MADVNLTPEQKQKFLKLTKEAIELLEELFPEHFNSPTITITRDEVQIKETIFIIDQPMRK